MSHTNTRHIGIDIPEKVYQEILSQAETPATGERAAVLRAAAYAAVVSAVLSRKRAERVPHPDKDERFGAGKHMWEDDADFERFIQRGRKAPYMDVARLARPDGETERVPFRITPEMDAWLEERQKVLGRLPKIRAFYDTIDGSTTLRHILAREMLLESPLSVCPTSGGRTTTVSLPRELHKRLEARVPEVKAAGARSSAGVGTVIRWVLAAVIARTAAEHAARQRRRDR